MTLFLLYRDLQRDPREVTYVTTKSPKGMDNGYKGIIDHYKEGYKVMVEMSR